MGALTLEVKLLHRKGRFPSLNALTRDATDRGFGHAGRFPFDLFFRPKICADRQEEHLIHLK